MWWSVPVNTALGRLKQETCYKFTVNLVYKTSTRLDRAVKKDPVSKIK